MAKSLIKNAPKSPSHGKPPAASAHTGKANIIETVVMKIAEAIAPPATAARGILVSGLALCPDIQARDLHKPVCCFLIFNRNLQPLILTNQHTFITLYLR